MVKKKSSEKKEEKLLVSTSEIDKEVKEDKNDETQKVDEEPSWYHYTIVLLGFVLLFAGAYFALDYFEDKKIEENKGFVVYDYYFSEGDRNGRIQFYTPTGQIDDIEYDIGITKLELFDTEEFFISFGEYNGSDNGEIARTSGRLFPLLQKVYLFPIDVDDNIVREPSYTCINSTIEKKVVIFNPYSDRNAVTYDKDSGCIEFLTTEAKNMAALGDKFFYTIINE